MILFYLQHNRVHNITVKLQRTLKLMHTEKRMFNNNNNNNKIAEER